MGAAAGDAVQAVDRDHAQHAFAVGFLAQAEIFLRVVIGDGDRPVLADDLVGSQLDFTHLGRIDRGDFQVDGADCLAQMETDGVHPVDLDEDGGEQVLAAVLLHMIVAARPIDLTVDLGSG